MPLMSTSSAGPPSPMLSVAIRLLPPASNRGWLLAGNWSGCATGGAWAWANGAGFTPPSGRRLSFAFIVAAAREPSILAGRRRGGRDDPAYDVDRPPHQRLRRFKRAEGRVGGESHVFHARQRVVRLERLGGTTVAPAAAE